MSDNNLPVLRTNRKLPIFLVVMLSIAWFVGYAMPSPLGLEVLFDYILGPVGFMIGYGIGRVAEKTYKELASGSIISFAVIIILLVGGVGAYYWLYYNIPSLGIWTLMLEVLSFVVIFLPVGFSVRLAGLPLIGEKNNELQLDEAADSGAADEITEIPRPPAE